MVAHAGDGNTHPHHRLRRRPTPTRRERARAAFDEIMAAAIALGGTITGEHGVGRAKRAALPDQLGPDVMALTRAIKNALDPHGILNPGKVSATLRSARRRRRRRRSPTPDGDLPHSCERSTSGTGRSRWQGCARARGQPLPRVTDVATFIASGNVRVTTTLRSAAKVERKLERVMEARLGFDVPAMVPQQLTETYAAGAGLTSPVPGSPQHAAHCSSSRRSRPGLRSEGFEAWDRPKERAQVIGREVHLWLGSERPQLTNASMEKILGTAGTARDWKTVTKLADIWG